MQQNENIKKAVDILDEAQGYALDALKNEPMLSLRVSNAMTTLINGLNHIGGFVGQSSSKETIPTIHPAKTFMGLDLEELDKQQAPAKVVVELDEKEKFKKDVNDLYAIFYDKDENAIKDAVAKPLILGVAKLAGLEIENPSSKQISLKFIKEIKEAIKAKADLDIEKDKVKENLNIGGAEGSEGANLEGSNTQSGDSSNDLEKEK